MTTQREYAISLGLAKAGRGRLSLAAAKAIAVARSKGMVFDDGPQVQAKPAKVVERRTEAPTSTDESVDTGPWKPSQSALKVQAKLGAMHEAQLFDTLTLRRLTFVDGADHRTHAAVTGRYDAEHFYTHVSMTKGACITFSSDIGYRTVPLSRIIKVSRHPDPKQEAAFKVWKMKQEGRTVRVKR